MNKANHELNYKIISLTLSIMGIFLLLSLAQADEIPSGSYKRTCKDYKVSGFLLLATCLDRHGDWKSATIIYTLCSGDIWNDNGDLKCNISQQTNQPKGSYKKSCKDIRVDGKYLKAECKKHEGGWRYTDINYKNCDKDIINDNGRLKCGQGYFNLPRGSYKQTCRNVRIDGNYLKAECRKYNGSWRYTDIKYDYCDDDIINDNGRLTCY
jgi:hypothetical protein